MLRLTCAVIDPRRPFSAHLRWLARNSGKPVDMYGCVLVLYIATEVFVVILKGEVRFQSLRWAMVSDDAKDFVGLMLQVNGNDRPTAVEALAHSWLSRDMPHFDSDFSVTSSTPACAKMHMGRVNSHVEN